MSDFADEYEAAATAAHEAGPQLPFLSPSGFWLQSYGFSKVCLNSYCRLLSQHHPSLVCVACTPGFVETDMTKTYSGDSKLRSVDEGGELPAWLACGNDVETECYYKPDKS